MTNDRVGLTVDYGDILRRSAESLFRTFEDSSAGTLIADRDARIVWMNERYAASIGVGRATFCKKLAAPGIRWYRTRAHPDRAPDPASD